MTSWDATVDLVVVGSGGGGLTAALAAVDAGAKVLVVEKQGVVGGSTAMSGGVVWIPNNPLMRAAGVPDSYEDAMAHFDAVVGDVGPASSEQRRHTFLTAGLEMLTFLQRRGVRFAYCRGYSDYYSDAKGGIDEGRAVEPKPFNGNRLGEWGRKLQPGLAKSLGMAVMTNEARSLSHYNRSLRAFAITTRVVMRTAAARAARRDLLTNGAALIAQLLGAALERGAEVWVDSPLEDLIADGGRVVGVRISHDGSTKQIEARRGVLLSAGGFAHNPAMRGEYGGDQPNNAKWSMANPGDTGEAMQAAMQLGAKTDFMDEAWWIPSPRTGRFGQSTLDQARQRPRAIYVDAAGRRFVNESNSYMEVGKAMYERNKTSRAVPCWLIFDDRYRKRYAHVRSHPGWFPKEMLESGKLKRAATLEALAAECNIDPAGLADTIETFNRHAAEGRDPEYGRGESAYNKALGDPSRKVKNPCIEPLDQAPYYAVEVLPGDIGTCGGLLTNEHAQVLDQDDKPIPGLYATGNTTATVMGRHYLGPGASIANSMVFGYVAARHATGDEAGA
ncbi:MAG: FAD-dependent oxidoreductase [Frankiaceae bacterium]|nr:FAD-dependent oxidoreductase [Frankiaceae bacterium]MBV9870006.1 FAD-dependent oxidoreductase [Frankiaceae bacterium]